MTREEEATIDMMTCKEMETLFRNNRPGEHPFLTGDTALYFCASMKEKRHMPRELKEQLGFGF